MSWSIGFDSTWNRDIGYGVPAYCDLPDCWAKIDRGLDHVCGGEPYGGEKGCGLYFCDRHLFYGSGAPRCRRCLKARAPYPAKEDHEDWIHHKETDPSWEQWRATRAEAQLAAQGHSRPADRRPDAGTAGSNPARPQPVSHQKED